MQTTHDPYLNTAKRSLQNKKLQKRKQKYTKKINYNESQSFLSQKIVLHNYLNLPESLQNIIGLTLFMFVPYSIGLLFIFVIVAKISIETYEKINMHSFLLSWTIGYEIMASLVLLLIIKDALLFKRAL